MNSTSVVSLDAAAAPQLTTPSRLARLFYPGAALVVLALMLIGFQQFYLHGRSYPDREIPPPIRGLIIAHGVTMSIWVLLFVVQPLLIASGNFRVHQRLGVLGAVLAAVIFVLGWMTGVESTRIAPPDARIWGLTFKQFMAVPLMSIALFALLVATAVWQRRRPEIHRPLMLMATLVAIPAAVSRIDALNALYVGTVWERLFGPFFMTVVLGVILFGVKCALSRSFDRWFAAGLTGLIVSCALIMQIAPTAMWDRFASFVLGT